MGDKNRSIENDHPYLDAVRLAGTIIIAVGALGIAASNADAIHDFTVDALQDAGLLDIDDIQDMPLHEIPASFEE